MKKFYFIFLLLFQNGNLVDITKVSLVPLAIKQITDAHYAKNAISFDLIIYGRDTRKVTEIATQLLLLSKETFAGKV